MTQNSTYLTKHNSYKLSSCGYFNIKYFFYNGGGDSQDTAHKVSQISEESFINILGALSFSSLPKESTWQFFLFSPMGIPPSKCTVEKLTSLILRIFWI